MGKMGKMRRNSCTRKSSTRTKESDTKESHSKIKKCTQDSAHTLLEKYKNILGSRQPVIVLEKCSILKNISHTNSLQVTSKNSVNDTHNANHTSKLIHSTNYVSHQSSCIEKTTNYKSVHNLKVDHSKSSKISSEQAAVNKIYSLGKVSSDTEASKNVLKTSSTHSKRNASSKHKKSIPKIDESDSTSGSEKITGDHLQKNKLNEKIAKLQKCNTNTEVNTVKMCKRRNIYTWRKDFQSSKADSVDMPKTDFSINGTVITDTGKREVCSSENLDLISLQDRLATLSGNCLTKHNAERIVVDIEESTKSEDDTTFLASKNLNAINFEETLIGPKSNELSKHTKKYTVACIQNSTIMKDTENTLSASTRSFINSPANTVQSSERFIVSSSDELSKHTKKHTVTRSPKRTRIEDTEDTLSASTRNLINSATNIVQSFGRSIVLCSNDSNKQTEESSVVNIQKSIKVKEKVSKENNIEHNASHHHHELKSLQKQKRVHSENSSSGQDVKKVKLNRANWRKRLESVNKAVDTTKEVDKTEEIVKLKNNEKIPQLICAEVPRPSIVLPEEGNITYGIQVAEANLTMERVVSSIEKQNSTEAFGYSNRLEYDAWKDARKSQTTTTEIPVLPKTPAETHISVIENTFSVLKNSNFNNSSLLCDEDDCISLYADSKLIEEYDVSETFQSQIMNETSLVTEKQYPMTNKMIEIFYNKNALEFNEAYSVNYFNNTNTPIVPQRKERTKIDSQRKKSVETVPQREKLVEIVPKTEKPVETVSQREKPVEIFPKTEKSVETVSQREKSEIFPFMGQVPVQTVGRDINAWLTLNPQTRMNMRTINQSNQDVFLSVFRGFCYATIRTGICYRNSCHYNHDFTPYLMLLHSNNETRFFEVIDDLIQKRHTMFLKSFYKECIRPDANLICVLKLLKKLYNSSIIRQEVIYGSIKQLIVYGATVNQIVNNLAKIVNNSDTQFLTSVLQVLLAYTASGNSWPMLKPLLTWINELQDVIRHLLLDCITARKHIQDVYEHVVCKLDMESLTPLNQELLIQFNSIHRQISENAKVQETVASTSVTIASPNSFNEVEIIPYRVQTANLLPKVWKNVVFDDNNNMQGGNSSALLLPIDNVPNPCSKLSRERFWKFYLDVHSLEEGLKHKDYRHVKKILDEAQKRHVSPFTNACYNILRSKVEHSQAHLSKLASLAVQDGATTTFCKILTNVTIHILADMAERELWVLALALLKSLDGILHEQSFLLKFDAAVTMLFCEIYLANRKPMKAFNLLKRELAYFF